ncbi:hypothetical protein ACFFJX_17475 [Pseudarcicella hirudinis]
MIEKFKEVSQKAILIFGVAFLYFIFGEKERNAISFSGFQA